MSGYDLTGPVRKLEEENIESLQDLFTSNCQIEGFAQMSPFNFNTPQLTNRAKNLDTTPNFVYIDPTNKNKVLGFSLCNTNQENEQFLTISELGANQIPPKVLGVGTHLLLATVEYARQNSAEWKNGIALICSTSKSAEFYKKFGFDIIQDDEKYATLTVDRYIEAIEKMSTYIKKLETQVNSKPAVKTKSIPHKPEIHPQVSTTFLTAASEASEASEDHTT